MENSPSDVPGDGTNFHNPLYDLRPNRYKSSAMFRGGPMVNSNWRFEISWFLISGSNTTQENYEGIMILCNISNYISVDTASHSESSVSSVTPP